jgi:hypothetical protein
LPFRSSVSSMPMRLFCFLMCSIECFLHCDGSKELCVLLPMLGLGSLVQTKVCLICIKEKSSTQNTIAFSAKNIKPIYFEHDRHYRKTQRKVLAGPDTHVEL